MATNIEKRVKETLKKVSDEQGLDDKLSDYEKALKEFNELVEKGITKRRGYTLMTSSEIYSQSISLNLR